MLIHLTGPHQQQGLPMYKIRIRPIRIEGNIAYVPLTQGYEAIIDAENVPLVNGVNWCADVARRKDGSIRCVYAIGLDSSGCKPRRVKLHRVLMGEPVGFEVDHCDGNGLMNRRKNLRVATKSQNQHNQRLGVANASGAKGVSWYKRHNKWQAHITLNGKQKYLGLFQTIEAAAEAYAKASKEMHGSFGRAE